MSLIALALTPNVGIRRLQSALAQPDHSPEAIEDLLGLEIGTAYRQVLKAQRAEQEQEQAARLGARIIGYWDEAYPEALRHLASPPTLLYLKGQLPPSARNIAIVGTRQASPWALAWTQKIARELAEAGLGVISGLALGIDTAAHRGALEGGGYTLGVLGSALDQLYPAQNRSLAERMHLLSEFPLGTPPQAGLFPRRNRIVAALCSVLLVVEAGQKSGALITARHALELGRDVLAVPGRPGDPQSLGCNRLIQDGAGLVMDTSDILDAFGMATPKREAVQLEGLEARLYQALLEMPESLPDDLSHSLGVSPAEALSTLMLLQLKGLVQELRGGRYTLV